MTARQPTARRTRTLGGTGLEVGPVSLGTSYLGDPPTAAGEPDPGAAALAAAILAGPFPMVDTSNNYAGGRSETVLGRALATHGPLDGRWVATKADSEPGTGRFDRDRVWRSFEESTARLGLDRLPLLHLHDPHTVSPAKALGPGGAVEGLLELRDQGLVGALGVATGSVEQLSAYVASGCFDVLLTHNRYTLVDRRAEPVIATAAAAGMGVLNAAPFGGGLLAGRGTSYAYRESPPALLEWVRRAGEVCAAHGTGLRAAALWFSLCHPCIHSTVVGVSHPDRITDLESLLTDPVPDGLWPELAALGSPPSTVDD